VLCLVVLVLGVKEPERPPGEPTVNPIRRENLRRLGPAFWSVVALGAVFTLARFSEAFLVLRAQQGGLALAWTPLVLIAMNVVYAVGAYPFGRLSDRVNPRILLVAGLAVLVAADLLLAGADGGWPLWTGVGLWGLHMAMTQGLLAAMVAARAPRDLLGTAFGVFNLASGVALLAASVVAGLLWDTWGASATFLAGAAFAATAAAGVALLQNR
jgi:predicted MFS family arabinose efflux permease